MNYKLALKQVRDGQVKPVYVCFGQENYLMHQFIGSLTKQIVAPEHREFAMSKYDLAETSIEAVLEDVETLPFMVPKKIVIANNALFLTAARDGSKGSKIEHDVERLMSYIQSPNDFAVLVLTVQADKLDERRKIVKWLKEFAAVLSFQALNADDLSIWVSAQAEQLKCNMDHTAIQSVILNAGTDLQTLESEIKKIALYVGPHNKVTPEMIEQLVVRSLEQNIFKLIDEIIYKRLDRALSILADMLEQREEPIKILMLIARQFRIITQVKELSAVGHTQQQMASQLRLNPFAVKLAQEQSRRYDVETLSQIMSRLADLDYGMKTGKIEKVMGLELFILKLVG